MEFLGLGDNTSSPPILAVSLNPDRGCWVSLPPNLASQLLASSQHQLPIVLQLRHVHIAGSQPVYVAWTGAVCSFGCIGLPAALARCLSLPDGASVSLNILPDVLDAVSITLEPITSDDWEVVELNASHIEEQLLNQVGVVAQGQKLPLWVRGQQTQLLVSAVQQTVAGTNIAPVRLRRGCEVLIAPRMRHRHVGRESASVITDIVDPITGGGSSTAKQQHSSNNNGNGPIGAIETTLRMQQLVVEPRVHGKERILPASVSVAFVAPSTLSRIGLIEGDWVRICGPSNRTLVACVSASQHITSGHLALSQSDINQQLKADVFDLVTVTRLASAERNGIMEAALTRSVLGGPTTTTPTPTTTVAAASNGWAALHDIDNNFSRYISSPPDSAAASPLASFMSFNREALTSALDRLLPVVAAPAKTILQTWGAPKPGGVLVTGPTGSGKTSLMSSLCDILKMHPACMAAIHFVSCKDFSVDGGAAAVRAQLVPYLRAAAARPPSLIVLDDIDAICPAATENSLGDESHSEGDSALVSWLCQVVDGLAHPQHYLGGGTGANTPSLSPQPTWLPVGVIATATSTAAVPAALRHPGRLDTIISLPPPTSSSRAAMLVAGVAARSAAAEGANLHVVAQAAEGYDGGDINTLLDRAMQIAVVRQLASGASSKAEAELQAADFEGAMMGLTPATFWGVGMQGANVPKKTFGWEDVGGLVQVKEALQEALELPLRHAKLVARAPLRLRTGVLLYGPPGCGKTHIVAAAVSAVGMRCITVSGPELLNKYIGASEAAVRDVFRRAQAAAPSIIFFDEFDALAPQRGHDNTGVTDRVVNQLLTELDGVEGLKGVCVIAATSRPDLVDAALLRPGRLDRILHCGFPNDKERADILRSLSRNMKVAEGVEWEKIAAVTDHYSGADLGALLSEAQLAAAHQVLESASSFESPALTKDGMRSKTRSSYKKAMVVVDGSHLKKALATVKPSVSLMERQHLQAVYDRFAHGEKGQVVIDDTKKKVSWA